MKMTLTRRALAAVLSLGIAGASLTAFAEGKPPKDESAQKAAKKKEARSKAKAASKAKAKAAKKKESAPEEDDTSE